jgi:HEAT repeat protein
LERSLGSPDWRERRLAALALSHATDVKALAAALDDANGFVREAAAQSLRRLSESTDAPQSVRSAAAAALAAHPKADKDVGN